MNKYYFSNKVQSENWHGMDNPVTGLTIYVNSAPLLQF